MKKKTFILILAIILSYIPGFYQDVQAAEPESKFDGYIIKLKDGSAASLFSVEDDTVTDVYAKQGLYKTEDLLVIAGLVESGAVLYVEPNYEVTLIDNLAEAEGEPSLMSAANDDYYYRQWNLRDFGIETAWDNGFFGAGVKVAVIDSGVNINHEEFSGVDIAMGVNMINGSADVTDRLGHGTFISGIIAARRNNVIGIAGITDKITLIPIKCFDSQNTNIDYIISAIYIAVDRYGSDIINMSLGTPNNLKSLRDAVNYADSNNTLIISSVGNEYGSAYYYPAAYDNVIGVGSVNVNKEHSDFSQINDSVFVSAPGEDIYSLGISGSNSYRIGSGTSYATPHITAMAAMARGVDPELTIDQFKQLLIDSSSNRSSSGYTPTYGYGFIDFKKFAEYLQDNEVPEATAAGLSANDSVIYSGTYSTISYDVSEWFYSPDGSPLSFYVYSSTAGGTVSITGNILSYTISAKDVDKSVRIVIAAYNGKHWSELNAVLTINVGSSYSSSSADGFLDIQGHWAKKYVAYGVDLGLLKGLDNTSFGPDIPMTRAMFVTVLARLSGDDLSGYYSTFSDVNQSDWYSESVAWAQAYGIVDGLGGNLFAPSQSVSRQQMATIMYRYALNFGLDSGLARENVLYGYTDASAIASWAEIEMLWAVSNALISGKSAESLDPGGTATRAEVSTILVRFCQSFI